MSVPHIVILGAGAAGTAAARVLAKRADATVTLVGRTDETPYVRMNIKGVAFGPTPAELIQAPLPPVSYVADSVRRVDAPAKLVQLASGATLRFDALIIATGSAPRRLTGIPGAAEAEAAGQAITLHSLEDATRIRAALQERPARAHVAIYGGGATASETESMLNAAGHGVTLISRSSIPGATAFGPHIAALVAEDHTRRIATYYGRTIDAIERTANGRPRLVLDGGTRVDADLLVVALGTTAQAPSPWGGAVGVDAHLRATTPGVYAAGGVAVHQDDQLASWRVDHWEDSAAQGAHAAATVLSDLGLDEAPGPYRPRSAHIVMVHGKAICGIGYTAPAGRVQDGDDLVIVHDVDGVPVGASGIDSIPSVYQWAPRLHEPRVPAA